MGHFETSDGHSGRWHKPVCVPVNRADVFASALEMIADLPGWSVTSTDQDGLRAECERSNGPLRGTSTISIWVEGPEGIPNSTTHCRSTSSGSLLSRDKGNVAEFVQKFWMRVT